MCKHQYDHSTWLKLTELAGLDGVVFDHRTVYPDEHIYALVGHAAEMTGLSAGELHEKFGEYLVPDLMYTYQKRIKPEWKTLDMLEHTEGIMHRQVREGHYANWLKFFFEVGTKDETADRNNNGIIDAIDDTVGLIDELLKKGYDKSEDIFYLELQDGRHDVPTWAAAFPYFLKWGWGVNKHVEV